MTNGSSYLNRTTPGVYITEENAFGTGIVGVATAVPVFIGYSEFAGNPATGQALYGNPVYASLTDGSALSGESDDSELTPWLVCSNAYPGQLAIVSTSAIFTP